MQKESPQDMLDELMTGRATAIGWGCGDVFRALRETLHSFPLATTIHNSEKLQGTYVAGAKVAPPSILDGMDHAKTILVCYTRDFREDVHRHCARHPGLRVVDWDDPRLLDRDKPARMAYNIGLVRSQGLMPLSDVRQIARAFDQPVVRTPAYGGMEQEIRNGYDFIAQYQRDRYKALTGHVHFMHFERIPGDVAEFGTAYGTTATFLAAAMGDASQLRGDRRELHLFDSFQGLPEITHPLDIAAGWKQGAYRDKSAAELVALCREFIREEQIRVYEGWYKDTLTSIPKGTRYALVHIDCDIYESTWQVLEYLFSNDHVSNGCAILFDDWNCGHASPNLGERKAWAEAVERFRISYTDCGDYSAFGHKVIVHR